MTVRLPVKVFSDRVMQSSMRTHAIEGASTAYPCLGFVVLYPVLQRFLLQIQAQQSGKKATQKGQRLLQPSTHYGHISERPVSLYCYPNSTASHDMANLGYSRPYWCHMLKLHSMYTPSEPA